MLSVPIFLAPIFKETVWGGDKLADFSFDIPSSHTGECWCVCGHPHGDSLILNPEFGGITLSQLWQKDRSIFGNYDRTSFPLLTKIIDAKYDLSIQVHPDDKYAYVHENKSLGKTECWYVLDCRENSSIVIGHNARNREELKSMIENNRWKDLIREVPVHKGDFFFIEPGTVHAIKAGTMILETQQSSDITYRLYDYGRFYNGQLRPLHIKESLDVIKCPFEYSQPPLTGDGDFPGMKKLVACPYFTLWHCTVRDRLSFVQNRPFMICTVIQGSGRAGSWLISKGSSFILPYGYGQVEFSGNLQMIISAP